VGQEQNHSASTPFTTKSKREEERKSFMEKNHTHHGEDEGDREAYEEETIARKLWVSEEEVLVVEFSIQPGKKGRKSEKKGNKGNKWEEGRKENGKHTREQIGRGKKGKRVIRQEKEQEKERE
jgi:hypothetical protein